MSSDLKNNRYSDKNSVIPSVRKFLLDASGIEEEMKEHQLANKRVAVLLGELQTAKIELQKQNNELHIASELLQTERSKFEQLFNLAPVGYLILDKLGIIEELNNAAAELLAIPKKINSCIHFRDFVAPEDWERFYLFLHSLQLNYNKQSSDIKLALKNGAIYFTKIEGLQTNSHCGDQLHYYITITDFTEIRHAQQNLLTTTQRLEMTLSSSGTGTWSLDIDSRKIYMDDFCHSLFEIDKSNYDGTLNAFLCLIYVDDREKVWHHISNSINSSNELEVEFRIVTKKNEIRILSLKGKEVENDTFHTAYVGILSDVTLHQSLVEQKKRVYLEQQRLILSTTLAAQEKVQEKISAALHDSVCQLLYGIKLNIQNLQKIDNFKNEFKNINILIDQAIAETRELSYDLTPSVLRDFGFTAGVKEIAQRLSTTDFKINAHVTKEVDLLEPSVQLIIFRIMQELLNNCIKHSKARAAEIRVGSEGINITLIVTDNGIGFENNVEGALAKGSGLRGIKNRVFLLEGVVKFESSSKGTSISVKLKKNLELPSFTG